MYAVVDCDNCFVSCERVFQPQLKGRPVVVLSNNDGCVVARSNEAKALGVKMGVPIYQIMDQVEAQGIQIRSSNYPLYADMSNRVMSILRNPPVCLQDFPEAKDAGTDTSSELQEPSFVSAFEQYSIDEAFLTGSFTRPWAEALVRLVYQWTGMPVSVGIGPTRTLAKAATWFAKHYPGYNKVCIIATDEQREKALRLLEVGEVWGVGWRSVDKYKYYGIQTAYDLTQRSASWVQQHFTITGLRTWKELRGEDCIQTLLTGRRQTICTSRSFEKMVSELGEMEMYVSNFAQHCAQKLRKEKSAASMVTCWIQTNHFREDLMQYDPSLTLPLDVASNSNFDIVGAALRALRCIWREGYHYKRAGVIVSGISSANGVQLNLFDSLSIEERQRRDKLSAFMDEINRKYGTDTIQMGVQQFPSDSLNGKAISYKDLLKHDYRSRCYTTNLDDVIEVQ